MAKQGEWVSVKSARSEIDYPQLYSLLQAKERQGWRLRRQGHGWWFYCPCDGQHDPRNAGMVSISHSPRNKSSHYRRVRDALNGHQKP